MIRPLRGAHRAIWIALPLAIAVGLVAALSARPELPLQELGALGPQPETRLVALAAGAPDVLVYLAAAQAGDGLPADARLLGRLGDPLALPRDGELILYSVALERVVASIPAAEIAR